MSPRAKYAARALAALALGCLVLVAAGCFSSDPSGPGDTQRIHTGFCVIADLEAGGQPVASHLVYFSTWKTDDTGVSIQGTDMHFNRTTGPGGSAAAVFGYELLFDTESSTYKELVRCRVFATYSEQDQQADVYFTQNDLAAGDTLKTAYLSW